MVARARIFFSILVLGFLVVIIRLFFWQILKGNELAEQASLQYNSSQVVEAPRGAILASDGSWYCTEKNSWILFSYLPDIKKDINEIADLLAPIIIDKDDQNYKKRVYEKAGEIKSQLQRTDTTWVSLEKRLDNDRKEQIEEFSIDGIGFEGDFIRSYPEASSAAHLLGFVGKNDKGLNQGYFGLEGYYDLMLSGKSGFVSRDSDAAGKPLLLGGGVEISSIPGVDLLTHVDKGVQFLIEEKLKDGLEKYGAVSGTVIVMKPDTGEVIAMASEPSFDPESYYDYSDDLFRNPVVSDSFEPGSVFKVIVMAAALDEGVIEPETKCEVCSGPYKVDKYFIRTWNDQYHPDSTMTEVIVNSDNVGMAYIGEKIGSDRLYDYLYDFGFGQLTNIDLQGEISVGLREKKDWNIVDTATATFGQGVAVTPIQLITAVSAIANDGTLMTPQVVDKILTPTRSEDIKPQVVRRVISEKAANETTAMMVEAAKSGEAKWTYLRGFGVAGKTGTAQIPIAGHYDEERTIASFIGFVPYDDPEFIMLVTLHEPQTSPWSSETAAPLWYDITEDLILHFGIQPKD
ncbi:penicillin-binding protein 2 [Candidatus Woesebacteria bacterium]|nr:penicillin-binding protein 2 [Candidatus Woesebacteria bacterium]